ncbi:MAG: hypothetical protein ACC683_03545 [Acidimicrobiia bacterium]
MMKRTLTVFLAAALLATFATPALAGDEAKVQLKTKKTAAVVEGDTAWVAISWMAKKADASDFRITASTNNAGVTISYPENTDPHSSLWDTDTLSNGEIDFTSLQVSVPYGSKDVKLIVAATWTSDGKKQSKDYKVKVPVARFKGDDVAQSTDDVGSVPIATAAELDNASDDGKGSWLGVDWTGLAPVVEKVQMTVTGPKGLVITYPGEGSFTSLYYDDTLEDSETDTARFRVDTSGMTAGKYTLDLELSYTIDGEKRSVKGQVSFEVTG